MTNLVGSVVEGATGGEVLTVQAVTTKWYSLVDSEGELYKVANPGCAETLKVGDKITVNGQGAIASFEQVTKAKSKSNPGGGSNYRGFSNTM